MRCGEMDSFIAAIVDSAAVADAVSEAAPCELIRTLVSTHWRAYHRIE
jgi:hypothetical protein